MSHSYGSYEYHGDDREFFDYENEYGHQERTIEEEYSDEECMNDVYMDEGDMIGDDLNSGFQKFDQDFVYVSVSCSSIGSIAELFSSIDIPPHAIKHSHVSSPPNTSNGPISFTYFINVLSLASPDDIYVDNLAPWDSATTKKVKADVGEDGKFVINKDGKDYVKCYSIRHINFRRLRKIILRPLKNGVDFGYSIVTYIYECAGDPIDHSLLKQRVPPSNFRKAKEMLINGKNALKVMHTCHLTNKQVEDTGRRIEDRPRMNRGPPPSIDWKKIDMLVKDGGFVKLEHSNADGKIFICQTDNMKEVMMSHLLTEREILDVNYTTKYQLDIYDSSTLSDMYRNKRDGSYPGVFCMDITFSIVDGFYLTVLGVYSPSFLNKEGTKHKFIAVAYMLSSRRTRNEFSLFGNFLQSVIERNGGNRYMRTLGSDGEAAFDALLERRDLLWSRFSLRSRIMGGVSILPYTTNAIESLNGMLKLDLGNRRHSLNELMSKLKDYASGQDMDMMKSLYCCGRMRFEGVTINNENEWNSLDQICKEKILKSAGLSPGLAAPQSTLPECFLVHIPIGRMRDECVENIKNTQVIKFDEATYICLDSFKRAISVSFSNYTLKCNNRNCCGQFAPLFCAHSLAVLVHLKLNNEDMLKVHDQMNGTTIKWVNPNRNGGLKGYRRREGERASARNYIRETAGFVPDNILQECNGVPRRGSRSNNVDSEYILRENWNETRDGKENRENHYEVDQDLSLNEIRLNDDNDDEEMMKGLYEHTLFTNDEKRVYNSQIRGPKNPFDNQNPYLIHRTKDVIPRNSSRKCICCEQILKPDRETGSPDDLVITHMEPWLHNGRYTKKERLAFSHCRPSCLVKRYKNLRKSDVEISCNRSSLSHIQRTYIKLAFDM